MQAPHSGRAKGRDEDLRRDPMRHSPGPTAPRGAENPLGDGELLYAFDLIELDGQDLPREPLVVRKATLASLIGRPGSAFGSMGPSQPTARQCSCTPASSIWKASCRSGRTPITAPGRRAIGSRAKTPTARRYGAKRS